jgi:signal transduction histidine kinase
MGGQMWVESEEGHGSRFAFALQPADDVTFPNVEV